MDQEKDRFVDKPEFSPEVACDFPVLIAERFQLIAVATKETKSDRLQIKLSRLPQHPSQYRQLIVR